MKKMSFIGKAKSLFFKATVLFALSAGTLTRTRSRAYNALGELVSETDALGNVISTTRSAAENAEQFFFANQRVPHGSCGVLAASA